MFCLDSRPTLVRCLRSALLLTTAVAVFHGPAPAVAAKGAPPRHTITGPLDFVVASKVFTMRGGLELSTPDGPVVANLDMDTKGRVRGLGTFGSAVLSLSGKTKFGKKGQSLVLKGTANVNGKANTKLSTKGTFVNGRFVGTTTLTDKARSVSHKKLATNTLLPLGGVNARMRIRFQFEGNATPSPTGFVDTDVGRFELTKVIVKLKGAKDGGDDVLTIQGKGKGVKVKVTGTNDGTTITGNVSGKVGPYTIDANDVTFPSVAPARPFAQDLGSRSLGVSVRDDGTLLGPVSLPLNGGASLDFAAGTLIQTRDGRLVRGPITIEVDGGGVAGSFPGAVSQEIAACVRVRLRNAASNAPTLLNATFDPPAQLRVELGDTTTSFGQGIWVATAGSSQLFGEPGSGPGFSGSPDGVPQGGIDDLLLGGSGGGGGGDRIGDSPFTSPGYGGPGGAYFIQFDEDRESIPLRGTGPFAASHVPQTGPNPAPPAGDREVFFPLDPVEDLGVKVKSVSIVSLETGETLATLRNSSGAGFGILDGAAVGVSFQGAAVFTATVIDGGAGPEIQIDTDAADAFTINWRGCLPNDDPVSGSGVPADVPPPPNEEGDPDGPYVGNIVLYLNIKPGLTGRERMLRFRRFLRAQVEPDAFVSDGLVEFLTQADDSVGRIQFTIEGYDASTGTLGALLPDSLFTVTTGHRTIEVTEVCPPQVPVVADLTNDGIVFFGENPFVPGGNIGVPGRPGRVRSGGGRIYTVSEGRLSCVDPSGGHVVGSRKIKDLVDGMEVSPLHDCIYVTTLRGEFIAIDPITLRDKWKISDAFTDFTPSVSVSPDGGRAVVTSPLTNQLVFIDLLRRTVERIDSVSNAQSVAWSPDGETVAVTDLAGGRVIFIDPDTGAQISTSVTGASTVQIDWSPDGSFVGVSNFGSNNFATVDTLFDNVVVSDPVDGANGFSFSHAEIDEAIRFLGTGFNDSTVTESEVDFFGEFVAGDRFDADFQPGDGTWYFDEFESFREIAPPEE